MTTYNPEIIWESSGTVFDTWGKEAPKQTLGDLNLGSILVRRKTSWRDFVIDLGVAASISQASPKYKTLIALIVLAAMNPIKVKKISDELAYGLDKAIKIDKHEYRFIDMKLFNQSANQVEIKDSIQWLEENNVGRLNQDENRFELSEYIIHSMVIA